MTRITVLARTPVRPGFERMSLQAAITSLVFWQPDTVIYRAFWWWA